MQPVVSTTGNKRRKKTGVLKGRHSTCVVPSGLRCKNCHNHFRWLKPPAIWCHPCRGGVTDPIMQRLTY